MEETQIKKMIIHINKVDNVAKYISSIKIIKKKLEYTENQRLSEATQDNPIKSYEYTIYKLYDNSISIGLCGYYMASVSTKFLCPFDSRRTMSLHYNFYANIIDELDEYREHSFSKDQAKTIPRCSKYCEFNLYEKMTNKPSFINPNNINIDSTNISKDCYEKVVMPILKDFVIKI